MIKDKGLFGRLLIVFFGAAIAIGIAWIISLKYLASDPYEKSFNRNIITYTRLIADKMRFDPLARTVIENAAGVKIYTSRNDIINMIRKKDLHFKPLTPYISVTKPNKTFFVLYENNFDFFLIRVTNQHYHPDRLEAYIVAVLLALLILFLAYKKVQAIFRPIERIQKMTIKYGEGKFDDLIPVEGDGQLADLTSSINDLAIRIRSMLDAKRDLLLAIGHEIKTPLARLRMQVEFLEEDQKSGMIENINEIKNIVDQLLEAERISHHSDLNKEDVNLVDFLMSLQDERVNVILPENQSIIMSLDPIRMELALRNIINNAKKYDHSGEKIILSYDQNLREISIRDHGTGVNEANISKLTDAFYRPDEARCRDDGGVGLGLYLVKNIIHAHDGFLKFENMKPGLKVIIKFPAA